MAMHKKVLSAGVLVFFSLAVFATSLACTYNKPSGVYQRAPSHSGHHTGFGRVATRIFKAGYFVVQSDDSSKLKKPVRKYFAPVSAVMRVERIALAPKSLFFPPKEIFLDLSPVLNL